MSSGEIVCYLRHLVSIYLPPDLYCKLTNSQGTQRKFFSVRKTIGDLEFSKHLLQNFLLACLSYDFRTSHSIDNCPFLTDFQFTLKR